MLLELDGSTPDFVEPQSEYIEEIAVSKIEQARAMVRGTPLEHSAILVEDSGLFIDSLGNFPGPYSSYVERTIGLTGILNLLKEEENREAEFRALAAISFDGKMVKAVGSCRGKIAYSVIGEFGFGYDPIFYVPEYECTSAELDRKKKNQLSHRGQAIRKLTKKLNEIK